MKNHPPRWDLKSFLPEIDGYSVHPVALLIVLAGLAVLFFLLLWWYGRRCSRQYVVAKDSLAVVIPIPITAIDDRGGTSSDFYVHLTKLMPEDSVTFAQLRAYVLYKHIYFGTMSSDVLIRQYVWFIFINVLLPVMFLAWLGFGSRWLPYVIWPVPCVTGVGQLGYLFRRTLRLAEHRRGFQLPGPASSPPSGVTPPTV
jgi:hypothetical protein